MLEIFGYMFCVYFVFKGVEIWQIATVTSQSKIEANIIAILSFLAGLVAAGVFAVLIHAQAHAIPNLYTTPPAVGYNSVP